jgi:hypothetical protein
MRKVAEGFHHHTYFRILARLTHTGILILMVIILSA